MGSSGSHVRKVPGQESSAQLSWSLSTESPECSSCPKFISYGESSWVQLYGSETHSQELSTKQKSALVTSLPTSTDPNIFSQTCLFQEPEYTQTTRRSRVPVRQTRVDALLQHCCLHSSGFQHRSNKCQCPGANEESGISPEHHEGSASCDLSSSWTFLSH